MKKIIIGMVLLIILSLIVFATGPGTITRIVTPSYGPAGQIFTVTLTATGSGDMMGIIKETKPSNFEFYDEGSWISSFDIKASSVEGDHLDIAFVESGASGYFEYKLKAGSSSGILSGNVEWAENGVDDLGEAILTICIDNDVDGYNVIEGEGVCGPVDCDDTVASCNVDCTTLKYVDSDNDGYGDPVVTQRACDASAGYINDNTDCDDTDAEINPGALEIPDNQIDDDCDGFIDSPPFIRVYSPKEGDYNDKRIIFNISLFEESDYLKYIDLNDSRPRNKTLCRDCNEYGLNRKRIKSLNEGEHNLIFYAINDSKTYEQGVSLFIDSTQPRITSQEPRNRKYCNGNFKVEYTEEYLRNIYLYYGNDVSVNDNCPSGRNQECEFNVPLTQYENKSIKFHFEVEDTFWKIPYRMNYTCLVDTIPPKFTYFNWSVDGRYLYLNISLDDEAKYLKYIDHKDPRLTERTLCLRCSEYGASRVKKKLFRIGEHDIEIIAEDEAGNRDTKDDIIFTII